MLNAADLVHLVDASLDGWLTAGRFTEQFERALARYVGVRGAVFVNSGSSANLLALSALTSPKLGKRRLVQGDEVITVAVGFPTTVNPIIQNRLMPGLRRRRAGHLRRQPRPARRGDRTTHQARS